MPNAKEPLTTTKLNTPTTGTFPTVKPLYPDRAAHDAQPYSGDTLTPEALKAVFREPLPIDATLKLEYAQRLLTLALQTRDADAALVLARAMDADPALDAAIAPLLTAALDTQPDAVYAFVRARLAGDDLIPLWLERLHDAGVMALQVAICDGDTETIISWLKLIAREPLTYGLSDVLHHGVLSAEERARHEPDLARVLVILAAKRDPSAVPPLLNDPELLRILPNHLGLALRDYTGDALALFQAHGQEVFTLALARAAHARRPDLFTTEVVETLWSLIGVPNSGADRVLAEWRDGGTVVLDDEAFESLLMLTLRDRREDGWPLFAHQGATRPAFVELLMRALHRSGRTPSEVLTLAAPLIYKGDLTQQGAVDLYIGLLELWHWERVGAPLMAQVARMLYQYPTLVASREVLWHMLETAAETKDEHLTRAAIKRLVTQIETGDDEIALTDDVTRAWTLIAWNPTSRAATLAWWRGFLHDEPLARLQRIDKALDGKRGSDDLHAIVQTVIAFRKMLGKRSPAQFAQEIGICYNVMQNLSEAFDSASRRQIEIDNDTLRAELDAGANEIPMQSRQVLANTLQELAQIVASMGDNRSKPGFVRRGDDIDHQLSTGEQPPHGAVDALKYIAGYLSGAQDRHAEEDDE